MSIETLLNHRAPSVRELAEKAQRYQVLKEQGHLTQDEYDALARQLLALKGINEAALSAEVRRDLQQAVQVLRIFLGVAL